MTHHLRETSLALAENVFITTEKEHGKYEECKPLSTCWRRMSHHHL
jgi:hypothetical protein